MTDFKESFLVELPANQSFDRNENLKEYSFTEDFLQQFNGTFIFALGIIASNNNDFAVMLLFFFSLYVSPKCPFNPCLSIINLFDSMTTQKAVWVNILAQFLGGLAGALVGLFCFRSDAPDVPYLNATIWSGVVGSMYGEIIGSIIFFMVYVIQNDLEMGVGDIMEKNIVITLSFQAARFLSYTANSVFNPCIAISFEFIESIIDGKWDRIAFLWVFVFGPFIGGFFALTFIKTIYREYFKIRLGKY